MNTIIKLFAFIAISAYQQSTTVIDWKREIMLVDGEIHTWVLDYYFRGDNAGDIDLMRAQSIADMNMRIDFSEIMGSQPFKD